MDFLVGVWQNTKPAKTKDEQQANLDLEYLLSDCQDKIEEYEENVAVVKELEMRYNDIKDALKKIMEGTYGFCEVSGEPIEVDRLEANQAARTCKAHME